MHESWQIVALREIASSRGLVGGPFGSNLGKRDYQPSGIPVIRGQNLASGRFVSFEDCVYVSNEKVERDLSGNTVSANDLVFTQRGTLGQVAVMPAQPSMAVLSQSQMRLRVDGDLADPWFVYYCTTAPEFVKQIRDNAIVAGVPHINLGILGSLKVPMPPLDEQRRIAGVLSAVDDLIDTNARLIQSCTAVAALVFRRLADNATKSVAFSETVDILSGGTPKTSEPAFWEGGSVPWFSVADTPTEGEAWVLRTSKHITELGLENSSAQLLEPGTTIVTARGTVGNVALVGVPMTINQSCYGLRSAVGRRGYFTFFATLASVAALRRRAHGSVFDTITRASFDAIDVPLPPTGEIEAFESLVDHFMQAARELLWESDVLCRSRDELLPFLLSGRVRVEDLAA